MHSESNMKQSEFRDLEILIQQENDFQRFKMYMKYEGIKHVLISNRLNVKIFGTST
jgi:hypothetical protein